MGAVLTPQLVGIDRRARPAQRLELLRTLRGGLPDGDSAARHDAGVAGARLRPRQRAPSGAPGAQALGLRREAPAPLSCARGRDGAGFSRGARAAGEDWAGCRCCKAWTEMRDLPAPQGKTFQQLYARASERNANERGRRRPHDGAGRIRAALGVASLDRARKAAVTRRLERHPRGTIPSRARLGQRGAGGPVQRDAHRARRRCEPGATRREGGGAIASYLGTCNLPPQLRMARTPCSPRCPGATPGTSSGRSDRAAGRPGLVVAGGGRRGGDRDVVPGVRSGQSDHAQFPPRGAHRPDRRRRISSAPMKRLGTGSGRFTARARCPAPSI